MTLKANELRIGNWFIQYDELEQFDGDFYHLLDIKFIPLTERWLFDFNSIKIGDEFIYDRFRLKYRSDYKFYYVTCKQTNAYITKVEFVHEWQNVVFALNNKELTLKNNLK